MSGLRVNGNSDPSVYLLGRLLPLCFPEGVSDKLLREGLSSKIYRCKESGFGILLLE